MTSDTDLPVTNEWASYWGEDSSSGEVFVGRDGQAHPDIAKWWTDRFASLHGECKVLDLASGAGSVFKHLPAQHDAQLFAADISEQALTLLKERFPKASTQQCSADSTPYQDKQFEWVVSQFGLEYAGDSAFVEAVRVLAAGGHLNMLCHIKDGHIDARNQAHLEQAQVIMSSDFIPLARDLIERITAGDRAKIEAAAAKFQRAEQQLAQACQVLPEGIHLHLYQGFRQMFENRAQYAAADIIAWLDDMYKDVERNIHRLTHMCAAARSVEQLATLSEQMQAAGCASVNYEPLQIAGHQAPVAWAIKARK